MNEQVLQAYLLAHYPKENEGCEWKEYANLKHFFAGSEGGDIISYVSGIANMNGGQLIIGVEDRTGIIKGIADTANHTPENLPQQIANKCPNVNTEGLQVEEFVTTDTGRRVWIVHIPRHLPRRAVVAHSRKWQRLGDSLVYLTPEREAAILAEPLPRPDDWGRGRLLEATLADLEPSALSLARQRYKSKHQNELLGLETDSWDDITFLNKAGLALSGSLTRAALLLLGNKEAASVHLGILPRLTWILKNERNEDQDYRHFYPPLLTAVDALFDLVRNLRVRYIKDADTLFPEEVDQYDPYVMREALHNCIAHQDYATGSGRVFVVEFPDKLVFTNAGPFLPGSVEEVIRRDAPDPDVPTPFLPEAMVQLNMIDTVGSGIKRMFTKQRAKFFPLPDYDLRDNKVIVTVTGKVLDLEYARVLSQHPGLTLEEIMLLDKVQKHKPLVAGEVTHLRTRGLIEGRPGAYYISSGVAAKTNQNVTYLKSKGLSDGHYEGLIMELVMNCQGVSRADINQLLWDQLPLHASPAEKTRKIDQLINKMRRQGRIVNQGIRNQPKWVAGPTADFAMPPRSKQLKTDESGRKRTKEKHNETQRNATKRNQTQSNNANSDESGRKSFLEE